LFTREEKESLKATWRPPRAASRGDMSWTEDSRAKRESPKPNRINVSKKLLFIFLIG
jgi:hypothetical protein